MSNALVLHQQQLPLAVGDLDSYIQAAQKVPMLTADEEYSLAVSLKQNDDMQAAQRLILSHLRFVIRIARDYKNYGLQMADLIQEGNIGLMKAVKRFDPEQGFRLATYAVHWIRAEIYEFVVKNWRIVKVATTKAQRKLFFNLHRMKKHLGWFNSEQVNDVAKELNVKPEEVVEMESRLAARDQLFDPWSHSDEDNSDRYQSKDYLVDQRFEPSQNVENEQRDRMEQNALKEALVLLDDRQLDIVTKRWLQEPKATLEDLSEHYGVSKERIRQIEVAAFKKMQKKIALLMH